MTLLEMKMAIWRMMGEKASEPYTPASDLVIFLNQSALKVATHTLSNLTWGDTVTVAGDDRYPFPVDFLSLKDVHITVGNIQKQLSPLPNDRFMDRYASAQSGEPRDYLVQFGATSTVPGSAPGDIRLGPTPAEVYPLRITYYQRTSVLVDVSDDNNAYELAAPFHMAVCYDAAMNLSLQIKDTERITYFKALYDQAIIDADILVGRMDRSEPASFERAYGLGRHSERRRR